MQRAVSCDLVMFDFLRRANQASITHFAFLNGFDNFLRLFHQAFQRMALHALKTDAFGGFYQLIETFNLAARLFQMRFKCRLEFFIAGCTGHFWQGAGNLFLCAVNIR